MPVKPRMQASNYFGAVPAGSWTLVLYDNFYRKWASVQCPISAVNPVYVALTYGSDVTTGQFGMLYLDPGQSAVFSVSGDMPWYGSIMVQGVGGASYVYITESEIEP